MLQEAVDALIDNGRRGRPVTGPNNRALKSLSDMLKGKQGRFRQNLLGKRVDYSGRSVIVVGPELKMYQCGLPKEMALELFKPFVMKDLVEKGIASNIKSARKMVERVRPEVWDSLESGHQGPPGAAQPRAHPAPPGHPGLRAGPGGGPRHQAAPAGLHPLQRRLRRRPDGRPSAAVHRGPARSPHADAGSGNLLKPSDGEPVTVPTQDMILGSYYLTMVNPDDMGHGKVFRDEAEALMANAEGYVTLQAPIKVRRTMVFDGKEESALVDTTVGNIIFNTPIPQDLGYVDRTDPAHKFDYEIGFQVTKKKLPDIISRCLTKHGTKTTAIMLDAIKAQGYKYSTLSAITVAVPDAIIPDEKPDILAAADKKVEKVHQAVQPRPDLGRRALQKDRRHLAGDATEQVSDRAVHQPETAPPAQPHLYDVRLRRPRPPWTRSSSWPACAACWPTPPAKRWKCPSAPTTARA